MRTPIEALQEVRSRMVYFCGMTDGKYDPTWAEEIVGICDDIVKDAIAEPPRICDVGAAHEREMSKNASKNGANFGQLGDAAKLREALVRVRDFADRIVEDRGLALAIINTCGAALAAPARNCNLYATLDDARNAYASINELPEGNRDEDMRQWLCGFHDWLFAPATEQEGGNDGK